tara:strand:- start:1489 stop:1650 length:162 start_codon:yes stop_codon:yes gene_type:complete
MFEFLLYSQMTCVDAIEIIDRINAHDHMSAAIRTELIEVVQEATPHCPWDAND